jgi:uncharacterized membrane protein YvbJ
MNHDQKCAFGVLFVLFILIIVLYYSLKQQPQKPKQKESFIPIINQMTRPIIRNVRSTVNTNTDAFTSHISNYLKKYKFL